MDIDYERALQMYRDYPMPIRTAEDDAAGKYRRTGDDGFLIRNILFAGRDIFSENCRILVAGGGTGDSTLYFAKLLAERGSSGVVVHLDQSPAANRHCLQRVERADLTNVVIQERSLFDLDPETDGLFDYVNCNGVLHHLDDPLKGLKSIASVIKPDGGMGLWLYAKYGRAPLYHVQAIVKDLLGDAPVDAHALDLAKAVLRDQPKSSLGQHTGAGSLANIASGCAPDVHGEQIADRLLNFKDRPFSATELFQLLDQGKLYFHGWQNLHEIPLYEPAFFIKDPLIKEALKSRSMPERAEFAERWHCLLNMHRLYVSPKPRIPLLSPERVWKWIYRTSQHDLKPGAKLPVPTAMHTFEINLPNQLIEVLRELDGRTSVGTIAARLGLSHTDLLSLEILFLFLVHAKMIDSVA